MVTVDKTWVRHCDTESKIATTRWPLGPQHLSSLESAKTDAVFAMQKVSRGTIIL